MYIEEFNSERDAEFLKKVALPYFQELFQDLQRREGTECPGKITKATFLEVILIFVQS